jgi:hypothetical protein
VATLYRVWEVRDPDWRRVVLTEEGWLHILERHHEMEFLLSEIIDAVETPTRRIPGRYGYEEWFYGRGAGPAKWLKVSVHSDHGEGRIVTAFPRRAFP